TRSIPRATYAATTPSRVSAVSTKPRRTGSLRTLAPIVVCAVRIYSPGKSGGFACGGPASALPVRLSESLGNRPRVDGEPGAPASSITIITIDKADKARHHQET